MTSQAFSVKGTAPFWRLYTFTLRKNIPVIILGTILSVMAFPVFSVTTVLRLLLRVNEQGFPAAMAHGTGIGSLVVVWLISLVMIAVLSIMNLGFLHNKNGSDLFYSIPITRKALYLSRLAATFTGAVIPVLVSLLAGIAANLLIAERSGISTLSLAAAGLMFVASTAVLSITAGMFMLFTGHTFDAVTSFLVINIGLPVLALACSGYAESTLFGMSDRFNAETVFSVSPLGGMAVWLVNTVAGMDSPSEAFGAFFWVGAVWLLLGAAILAVSLSFAKRRRSEAAGEAYANPLLPVFLQILISVLAAFIFGELFSTFVSFGLIYYFFAVIGSLLASVLIGAIIRRGFKKVAADLAVGGIAAGLVLLFGMILTTGGFGYETRVPKAESIQSATFSCKTFSEQELSSTVFEQPEELERLTALHRAIIQKNRTAWSLLNGRQTDSSYEIYEYAAEEYADYGVYLDFEVTYLLKNGNCLTREYNVPARGLSKEIAAVRSSKNYMNRYSLVAEPEQDRYTVRLMDGGTDISSSITLDEAQKILDTYAAEMRSGKKEDSDCFQLYFEDLYISDSGEGQSSYPRRVNNLSIPLNFTETLAALRACGFNVDEALQ